MTIYQRLQSFPPALCRLLARKPYGRPLTLEEIVAQAAGREGPPGNVIGHSLAMSYYERLCQQTDWLQVPTMEALHYLRGCGLDIDDAKAWRRASDYLRKNPTFRYLRASKDWETYYLPLLKRWRASYPAVPGPDVWLPIRALLVRLTPLLKQ